jgi:molybdopterin molybdotransferase
VINVEEARRYVLSRCRPLGPVEVSPSEALGLVLAQPIRAREAVPPFANSSMDGYALRAGDVARPPARLRVVGELMAGDDPGIMAVGPGEAVRIMTGAAIPAGADAVCMVERTRDDGDWVVIDEAVAPGTYTRPAGDDVAAGDEVFAAGDRVGAAHVGVFASLGVDRVRAFPAPRVGVVSTGDELVSGLGPLPPGKIRDSNRPGLLARLRADGFVPVDLGQAADDAEALVTAVQNAARECDAVLTSGGVSVGDRDLVKVVLEKLGGADARWLQVAVRPAKPFAFCTLPPRGVPVFGLPGNPVSALVSYELFARPALRLMAGYRRLGRPVLVARAEVDLRRSPDGKLHLLRVVLSSGPDGALRVAPSGGQGSHQMSALAGANALALVPDGDGVAAGESVKVWLLEPDGLAGDEHIPVS